MELGEALTRRAFICLGSSRQQVMIAMTKSPPHLRTLARKGDFTFPEEVA